MTLITYGPALLVLFGCPLMFGILWWKLNRLSIDQGEDTWWP